MKIKYINTLLLISTLFLTACNFNTLNNDDGKSDNTNKNTSTQEQNQNQKNQSQYNQQKTTNNQNFNNYQSQERENSHQITPREAEKIVYEKFVSGGHSMDEVKTLYNKSTNERYFIEFMSAHADGYPIRLAVWVNKADGSTSQPIDISTEDEKRRFEEHKANSKIYNPPKEGLYNEDNTSHSDSFQKDKSKNRITSQEEKFNSTSNGNSSKNEK